MTWALAVFSGLAFAMDHERWYLGALALLWIACGVIGIGLWRCPRCGEQFGRTWSVPTCPHCFLELEAR